jgi:uncharacterized surface protein with fasciclin (FAS1) repeats
MKMLMKVITAATAALAVGATPALAAPQAAAEKAEAGTAAAASGNIVATAKASNDFSTLSKAIEAAGLAETLSTAGPYTVFAPTDAAFAKLPAGTLDSLMQPANREQLKTLLSNHVVSGQAKADFFAGKSGEMTSLGGTKLALDGSSGVKVNGATVVKADIAASNGVIHAIDTVLVAAPAQSAAVAPQP